MRQLVHWAGQGQKKKLASVSDPVREVNATHQKRPTVGEALAVAAADSTLTEGAGRTPN